MAKLFPNSSGFRLKPLQVSGYPNPIDPVDGRLALGRGSQNDVALTGGHFPSVSTEHAVLEMRDGALTVEDLDSRNGTYVNGAQIEGPQTVEPGDVIQLGSIGPRFVVVSSAPLSETMFVDPAAVGIGTRDAGLSETRVHALVARKSRRHLISVVTLAILGTVSLALWGKHLMDRGRAGDERIAQQFAESRLERDAQLATLQTRALTLEHLTERRAVSREQERASYERRLEQMEEEKVAIERSRSVLQARFEKLERDGTASTEMLTNMQLQLADTRKVLEDARATFELMDPVNVEQARLAGVSRVRAAIVLIEVELTLRHRESGNLLHMSSQRGVDIPNLDGMGKPWSVGSTGSAFCVSDEGWMLTNAHVVAPEDADMVLEAAQELDLEPVLKVEAVFSGESRRHPVEVVRVANAPGEDLALIKIEPFEGLPYIDNFGIDQELPEAGGDVYLFGFPLGNYALQQGETVIASTFRGILSRIVGGRMQVDAGVHPGNSGGPVTDAAGRVVGVVYSVQALPDHSAVYTIGYAIPIRDAALVWPPPAGWSGNLAGETESDGDETGKSTPTTNGF